MNKVNGRILNWRPDLPDARDFLFKVEAPKEPSGFRDFRPIMPPIVNQYQLSSCTGNALAAQVDYLQMLELIVKGKQSHEYNSKRFVPSSRLMIYWNGRVEDGFQFQDSGAYIRSGIKGLFKVGVCREEKWKYETKNVLKTPTKGAMTEASKYKIKEYVRLISLNDMKTCLDSRQLFTFGFSVFEGFYNVNKQNPIVPMPLSTQRVLGGHAVTCVGYNELKKQFIVRNSWGEGFGENGYCYFPYEYLGSTLASDFWTVKS